MATTSSTTLNLCLVDTENNRYLNKNCVMSLDVTLKVLLTTLLSKRGYVRWNLCQKSLCLYDCKSSDAVETTECSTQSIVRSAHITERRSACPVRDVGQC